MSRRLSRYRRRRNPGPVGRGAIAGAVLTAGLSTLGLAMSEGKRSAGGVAIYLGTAAAVGAIEGAIIGWYAGGR